MANVVILINPVMNKEAAAASLQPMVDFGNSLKADPSVGAQMVSAEFPSFGAFFSAFTKDNVAVGVSSMWGYFRKGRLTT